MLRRVSSARRWAAVGLLASVSWAFTPTGSPAEERPSRELELERIREEIETISRDLEALESEEQGLVAELRRVDAELRLRQKEHDEVTLRREQVEEEIALRDGSIEDLEAGQRKRRQYIEFRLREVYKSGAEGELRRLLGDADARDYWDGVRYAGLLSERDRARIESYRADQASLATQRVELAEARGDLLAVEGEVSEARRKLAAARRRHAAALEKVRSDQDLRRSAIVNLEEAATEVERVIAGLGTRSDDDALDVRKFRGLLDWPVRAPVRAGFGTVVHPQFKTEVPHPGWDLAAEFGADIRAVFDGEVAFADWMRGYGLTVIVDHGGGVMSIYAHASVLMVARQERVFRGQLLGKVGETASLRGPVLYFEIRDEGRPVDPARWLRPR